MSQLKSKYISFGTGTGDVNSQNIPANYTPTSYTPAQVGSEGTTKVSAHLKGINNALSSVPTYTHSDQLTLTASGTITLGSSLYQDFRVSGNSSAVTLSNTPFGTTPPNDGTIITIFGNSNTNTVTLTNNDASNGCILNGDVTLGQYDSIQLKYKSSFSRYIEICRS